MMILREFGTDTASTPDCAASLHGFFAALARAGLQAVIPNVSAKMGTVTTEGREIPFLVSICGGGPCYLASFTRTFIDGAAGVLAKSSSPALKLLAPGVLLAGPLTRALALDDLVIINSNLFATCVAEDWSDVDITAMTEALAGRYPTRALWVRGPIDRLHGRLLERLRAQGFLIVPSRPVEILDPTSPQWKASSNLRKDFKKLGRLAGLQAFVGGPFSADDFQTMARLCRLATVERHSLLMPQYSAAFFEACAAWPECRIVGLREPSGKLRGFANVVVGRDMIACGTSGYDPADEQARKIYSALATLEMHQAIELHRPFNFGFGATQYKRVRGTEPAIEMGAFYVRHLPTLRRHAWQTVLGAIKVAAGPVARRI